MDLYAFIIGFLSGISGDTNEFKLHWYMIPVLVSPIILIALLFIFD